LPPASERAAKIRERLARAIPKPKVELDFADAWQLLVATMLAAQSTDRTINTITPELFRRWTSPAALGSADANEVEVVVRSSGYFRQKASAIIRASRVLVEEYEGEVPKSLEALVTLPGVARKTANVVLGSAYGITSGIVVDTHVTRLAGRLGLSDATEPVVIEEDLCKLFARRSWVDISHRLILHGRYVCVAKVPYCQQCPIAELCPASANDPIAPWTVRAAWERRVVESRSDAKKVSFPAE